MFTRLVNSCWTLFQWALFLAVAAALIGGGYLYLRLDDEIRRYVHRRLADHYRELNVHVGGAHLDQDRGVTIYDLSIQAPRRASTPQPILSIDELYLAGDVGLEELVAGKLNIDRIVIGRATLRAVRQPNGRWNVKSLVPLPKFSEEAPTIVIQDATLILEDASRRGAAPLALRSVNATLKPLAEEASPATSGSGGESRVRFQIEGTVAGIQARGLHFEGQIDASDGSFDLSFTANGLEISPELLDSLPGVRPAELARAHVHGRADVSARIVSTPHALAPLDWSARVKIDRGRIDYPPLPAPLTELTITLEGGPEGLRVDELAGKFASADVTLACERRGWATNAPLGVAVRIVRLPIDEGWMALLPPAFASLWDRFEPTGTIDVEARATFDGRRWSPQLAIECRDISLTDEDKFPYRLERVSGTVQYRPTGADTPDELKLELAGTASGRPIHIHGNLSGLGESAAGGITDVAGAPRVQTTAARSGGSTVADPSLFAAMGRLAGWIEVTGMDVPIHEELVEALSDDSEEFVRSLRPQGAIDFRWRSEWAGGAPSRPTITQEIELKDCTIQYARFNYPLRHIHGRITAHDRHWKVHGVQSRLGSDSTVKCYGESRPVDGGRKLDLVFQATDVPLDDHLRAALPPEAQAVWSELQPQGRIDLTAHLVHETGQPQPAVEIAVRPRGRSVSFEPRSFPYRFEQIEGEANYVAGRADLRNVRARHGDVHYSFAAGTWQQRDEGGWQFLVQGFNVDHFTLHRDLLHALPPRLQTMLERLQPSGRFNVFNSTFSIEQAADSGHPVTAWDAHLDCHQVSLQGGLPLEGMSGGIRLTGRDDGRTTHAAGELAIDSLIWKDLQLTNVRGPLWIDRSVCLLGRRVAEKQGPPQPITADIYGGSLAADASFGHDGVPHFRLDAAVGAVDLARFANERLSGPARLSGTVSGRLSLEGTGRSTHSLGGGGELHIVDANIYKLTVLVAMLKVLKNRTPDTTAFNQCDMRFSIQGEHVHFQQLNLLGDAVSLYGRGAATFNQDLDLVFYTLAGPADLPIPLWRSIAGRVSEQGLQLKVVGTLDQPEIQRQVLPAVDKFWQQVQQAGTATVVPPAAFRGEPSTRR